MAPPSTRTVWKGSISFGLVYIPIELFTGTMEVRPKFNMIDKSGGAPVGYRQVNKATGQEVAQEQIVKGIQVDEGQYVTLTKEEIRDALPKATQTIDIESFVDASEIDPAYYSKPYHVAPGARGAKPFALLRDTLAKTGKVGIARVVISTKQHLAALRPAGKGMSLNLLRWQEELREAPASAATDVVATEKEIKMAEMLVNDMVTAWSPDLFHDEFKEQLQALVEAKRKKGDITHVTMPGQEAAPPSAEIIDLTELLRRSLQGKTSTPVKAGKVSKGRAANDEPPARRAAAKKAPASARAVAKASPRRSSR